MKVFSMPALCFYLLVCCLLCSCIETKKYFNSNCTCDPLLQVCDCVQGECGCDTSNKCECDPSSQVCDCVQGECGCDASDKCDCEPSDKVDGYKRIPLKELQGWDDGLCLDGDYMVASFDRINNYIKYYILAGDGGGLYLLLNEQGVVLEVGNGSNCAYVTRTEGYYLLSWFDADGALCGSMVNCSEDELLSHSSVSANNLFDTAFLKNALRLLANLGDAEISDISLFNADVYAFLDDVINSYANRASDFLDGSVDFTVVPFSVLCEKNDSSLYKPYRNLAYGNCKIVVDSISKVDSKNIEIFLRVDGVNTIPSHLYHKYYDEPENLARNAISCGVVGYYDSVPYYNRSVPHYKYEVLLNNRDTESQSLKIVKNVPSSGKRLLFKGFIRNSRLLDEAHNVNANHIAYDDIYEISALDGHITKFEYVSKELRGDSVILNYNVTGHIASLEMIAEWGVYYLDDNKKYHYYPSDFGKKGNPSQDEYMGADTDTLELQFKVNKKDFVEHRKDIKLGVYVVGGYEQQYSTSEPQTFALWYFIGCDNNNHIHAVDLGLSVKWACCNVGATKPEEAGGYYAWGEIEEKAFYKWYNYKFAIHDTVVDNLTILKYNTNNDSEWFDNKTVLEPEDDVAQVKLGNGWRMPTKAEMEELITKCSWKWTTVNGVKGYKITSKLNEQQNSIFLPAVGGYSGYSETLLSGTSGYWTSTIYDPWYTDACGCFFSVSKLMSGESRCCGYPVRPVIE